MEALDRTLKDLRENHQLFGGATILLTGDCRQTLPVIPKFSAADELNVCLKSSFLWKHVKVRLIESVFPNTAQQYKNHGWLSERAILAGTNKDVNELNWSIQNSINGKLHSYKSVDTVINEVVNYPTEFLNSLDLPGLPPHNLRLKVCAPIIMLRNTNQPVLCNGTRLAVKKLMSNVIEATILNGKFKGDDVLIDGSCLEKILMTLYENNGCMHLVE